MENKDKFIHVCCNMVFGTTYNSVEDMPVEQYEFFNNIPYVSLIKPLVQKDKAVRGMSVRALAMKYGIHAQTAFNLGKV
jgi:hypothetical protein